MQCVCRQCQMAFNVTQADLDLLSIVSPIIAGTREQFPPPTLCPDCRQQRRLMYRNERHFYRRTCDLTGKEVISIYAPDQPCKVYDQTAWWSDDWDQLVTGRAFDFTQPFFAQYHAMSLAAPRPCLVNMSSQNSLFTNHSAYNKNCYMCINTGYCEDSFYLSDFSPHDRDCGDCLAIQKCEMCYECVESKQCSFSTFLHECINCSDCAFCYDCQGCRHCFGCWNLRHKEYCIFNEQCTKEQYEKRMRELLPATWEGWMRQEEMFRDMIRSKAVHKCVVTENCEASVGDHLFHCKGVRDAFYTFESEDCAHCYDTGAVKNCIDVLEPYQGELQVESHGCNLGYGLVVCSKCYECNNVLYSQYCWYCKDCFGCFGIRNKRYCILNRQVTKEQYEQLVPRIIEAMRKSGEWGEFFPMDLTPFAYNETAAQRYYPLTKEEAAKRGWKWREETDDVPHVSKVIPAGTLPERIEDIPDDIVHWAIECAVTKRPFRIVKLELEFYRKMKLPIPRVHPEERYRKRSTLRTPRTLWTRPCMKCRKEMQTTYAPERPETVYCEDCYLKEVY